MPTIDVLYLYIAFEWKKQTLAEHAVGKDFRSRLRLEWRWRHTVRKNIVGYFFVRKRTFFPRYADGPVCRRTVRRIRVRTTRICSRIIRKAYIRATFWRAKKRERSRLPCTMSGRPDRPGYVWMRPVPVSACRSRIYDTVLADSWAVPAPTLFSRRANFFVSHLQRITPLACHR